MTNYTTRDYHPAQVSWQERIGRANQIDTNNNMGPMERLMAHVQSAAEFYERDKENGCK